MFRIQYNQLPGEDVTFKTRNNELQVRHIVKNILLHYHCETSSEWANQAKTILVIQMDMATRATMIWMMIRTRVAPSWKRMKRFVGKSVVHITIIIPLKLKKELAKIEHENKSFGGKIVSGIRGLWGTRLTENVAEDKDLYVRTTIRELVLYLIFLVNLCVMSLGMTSSTHFYYTNVLQKLFLEGSADSGVSFQSMQQMAEFWDFAEGT